MTVQEDTEEEIFLLTTQSWECLLKNEKVPNSIVEDAYERISCLWSPGSSKQVDGEVMIKVIAPAALRNINLKLNGLMVSDIICGCLDSWTMLLRPFYEDPLKRTTEPTVLVRRQLNENSYDGDQIAIWDNNAPWRSYPLLNQIFLWCLTQIDTKTISKFESVSKLIPFVVTISDDYDPPNRLIGAKIISEFLRIVPRPLLVQMQLLDLFFQILMKNLSFDGLEIKLVSLTCLVHKILSWELDVKSGMTISWRQELLLFIIKECSCSSNVPIVLMYLKYLSDLIKAMGIQCTLFLPAILGLLLECSESTDIKGSPLLICCIENLVLSTWPRLPNHYPMLHQIVLNLPIPLPTKLESQLALLCKSK